MELKSPVELFGRFVINFEMQSTKIDVSESVVLTTLLHGSETRTPYHGQVSHFHMRCARQLCKAEQDDNMKNSVILEVCEISGREAFWIKSQMQCCGQSLHEV